MLTIKVFSDKNSVAIYGHKNAGRFDVRHLQDYDTREFWKNNPYFYIYLHVDGKNSGNIVFIRQDR